MGGYTYLTLTRSVDLAGGTHLEAMDAGVEVGEEAWVQLVHHHDRPLSHVPEHLLMRPK
jgi:hypothetical protein